MTNSTYPLKTAMAKTNWENSSFLLVLFPFVEIWTDVSNMMLVNGQFSN